MEPPTYQQILDTARRLSRADLRRLLADLQRVADQEEGAPKTRSILELQGLGKSVWAGIDAQDYVNRERASWSG